MTHQINYSEPITGFIRGEYPSLTSILRFIQDKYKTHSKHISEEQLLLIIKLYLQHEPSKKFFFEKHLSFDSTTLAKFSIKEYIDKEAEEEIKKKTYTKYQKKFYKTIADEMVALYLRKRTDYHTSDSLGRSIVYHQEYGHVDQYGQKIAHQTLSSEILNHKSTTTSNYNINLAEVRLDQSLLLIRSGRSDNIGRIQELVQFAFISSWNSSNRPGISYFNDIPVFQLSIFSAQDPHPIRNAIKMMRSSKKIPLDELRSLKKIKSSISHLWKDSQFVLFQVLEDEKPITFFAKKPLLMNFVLSQSAEDPQIIKDSREWSEESVLLEFSYLIQNIPSTSIFYSFFKEHRENLTKNDALSLIESCKREFINLKINSWEDEKIFLALKAIMINLTHKDFSEKEFLSAQDPGIELLYHFYLSNIINSAISVQCKAGCDRALIMTSLFLAKTQIEKEYKKLIDLANVDEVIHRIFIKKFGKFCSTFGIPILSICRGNVKMKGLRKPFLTPLFGDSLTENSIEGIKLVK